MDQAVKAYIASYLAGHDVILTAADWARCRELSRRIRGDLIHLGLVDGGRTVQIAEGAQASAGDLIICRDNDHHTEAGEPGRGLANGDVLRIEAITPGGIQVRRLLDPDPATGARRFTSHAFCLHRLPHRGPGLRDHRAFRARRHRAHRAHAGHRQRNPAMAVLRAGPRHRTTTWHSSSPHRRRPPTRSPAPAPHRSWNATNASAASAKASCQPRPGTDQPARTRASPPPCSPTWSGETARRCPRPRPGGATWPTPTTSAS